MKQKYICLNKSQRTSNLWPGFQYKNDFKFWTVLPPGFNKTGGTKLSVFGKRKGFTKFLVRSPSEMAEDLNHKIEQPYMQELKSFSL